MPELTQFTVPTQGIPMTRWTILAALSAGALLLASCGGATLTSPDERAASDVRLLRVLPTAPPLARIQASFWAVKGRNAGIDLYYQPLPGQRDSTKFMEFRLGGASLDRWPDGRAFAEGDSVLITVQVTDPAHLVVDYQPSGLRFSQKDLPSLKLFYAFANEDLNDDGRVDADDDAIVSQLSIWRQESTGQPWFRLPSLVTRGDKEVEARIPGFTGYAMMY